MSISRRVQLKLHVREIEQSVNAVMKKRVNYGRDERISLAASNYNLYTGCMSLFCFFCVIVKSSTRRLTSKLSIFWNCFWTSEPVFPLHSVYNFSKKLVLRKVRSYCVAPRRALLILSKARILFVLRSSQIQSNLPMAIWTLKRYYSFTVSCGFHEFRAEEFHLERYILLAVLF